MERFDLFIAGMVVGVILHVAIIAIQDQWLVSAFKEEAVASGHAEWIIETNESGEPEMKFQWKQLK